MLLPAVTYTGCKKQVKCGCGKDVIGSFKRMLLDRSSIYYNDDGTLASFRITNMYGFDTYTFCNPSEMYPAFKDLASEDQLLLSGEYYWDCTYMLNSNNGGSYYYYYYKSYQINVTEIKSYLYGKK